jgi:hypothetical protein
MKNSISTFEDLLNFKYGERGTITREAWEKSFEIFKINALSKSEKEENVFLTLKTP